MNFDIFNFLSKREDSMGTKKKLPLWLKGGVLAVSINLSFFFLFYICSLNDIQEGSFRCLPFIIFSPLLPFAVLFDKLNPFFEYNLSFDLLPLISSVSWFLIGSLIGTLINKYKKAHGKVSLG